MNRLKTLIRSEIIAHSSFINNSNEYYKFFGGVMKKDSVTDWANDIDRLEAELYKFADIKDLRPKRKAMKEAKAVIEEKYGVKLEELK